MTTKPDDNSPFTTARTQGSSTGASSQSSTYGSDASEVADHAKQALGTIKDEARQGARSQLESQRGHLTGEIKEVSRVLRDASRNLHEEHGTAATYVERIADQTDRLGSYLDRTSPREIADEVSRFARREPAMFIGGAFVLGIFAGRFLKSSARQEGSAYRKPSGRQRYGQPETWREPTWREPARQSGERSGIAEPAGRTQSTESTDQGSASQGSAGRNQGSVSQSSASANQGSASLGSEPSVTVKAPISAMSWPGTTTRGGV